MLASIDLSTTHASRVPVEMTERVELTERIEMTECGRDDLTQFISTAVA